MNWQMENAKDAQLLALVSLAPLDASSVAEEGDLSGMIEAHNARLAHAVSRVRRLASERERVANFDVWQHADSADIATARCCVRRESWDTILELRRVIEERQTLLDEMTRRLAKRHTDMDEKHRAAEDAAERRLASERRKMQKANPATAGAHFADMVAGEKSVVEAHSALVAARQALDAVSTIRRAAPGELRSVVARLREVFAAQL